MNQIWISLSEKEYRNLKGADGFPIISYSAISKYLREGFEGYLHLEDREETNSLTFGSAVDTLITEGEEQFAKKFVTLDNVFTGKSKEVLDNVAKSLIESNMTLSSVPALTPLFVDAFNAVEYYPNRTFESKIKLFCNYKGDSLSEYAKAYLNAKTSQETSVISKEMLDEARKTVYALKYDKFIGIVFATDDGLDRIYQAKFVTTINGVEYKFMFDLLIIDHSHKVIMPFDLKTTSKPEYRFPESFLKWRYDIQARLYCQGLNQIVQHSREWAGYKIKPMKFIVVNKNSLTPLMFEFEDSFTKGDIQYGNTVLEDPFVVGNELNALIRSKATLPPNIVKNGINYLSQLLKKPNE